MVAQKVIILVIFLLGSSAKSSQAEVESYFSPSNDCEEHIIYNIDNTSHTLKVAIYSITSPKIFQAIIRAKDRGVNIKILADRSQAGLRSSWVASLYQKGIKIRVHSKGGLMHNKFAIFDNKIFMTGSYNWTNGAKKRNAENCVFIFDEPEETDKFIYQFDYLWKINTQEKSDIWFLKNRQKLLIKNNPR